jgi:phage terminase small subunit
MANKSTKSATQAIPQGLSNPRQRAFVAEYMKDKNASAAYKRAGYDAKGRSADAAASRLLSNVDIQAELLRLEQEALEKVQAETGITLKRTLLEIARIAYFDPRKMFDSKGNPIAISDLDDDVASVVAGLDVLEEWDGSGRDKKFVGYIKKWKLADKKGALDMLMKHLGGYKEDNGQAGSALGKALAAGVTVRFVEAKR